MKRYDQKKLATILQKIAEDVVLFWKKYGGIGIFVVAPILMFGQDFGLDTVTVKNVQQYETHPESIRCITGRKIDGSYVAIFKGRDFPVVAVDNRWFGIIHDNRIIFIKIRKK